MEEQIKEKIREIAQSVNETIPVAWDNLYIGINLASDGGGVYYFFNEEGKDEYIYNLYIPKQYSIPISEFNESGFGPSALLKYFKYKYLGFEPRDEKELEQFKAMEAFQREHNSN